MQYSSWQRHQIRAQGRPDRRLDDEESTDIAFMTMSDSQSSVQALSTTPARDSATKAERLLNFLSKSAAHSERALLAPRAVPEFAKVKTACSPGEDQDLHHILTRKRIPIKRTTRLESTSGETLLSLLAETLAEQAAAMSTAVTAVQAGVVVPDFTEYGGIDTEPSEVYTGCMADLDKWLSIDSNSEEFVYQAAAARAQRAQSGTSLPAALPPVVPDAGFNDEISEDRFVAVVSEVQSRLLQRESAAAPRSDTPTKSSRHKRVMFSKNRLYRPQLESMPNGTRAEHFGNGADLIKDAFGRVVEIRTDGTTVQVHYDSEGKPDSFIRLNARHKAHSLGERDQHGVVVRDPDGRVRAQGESMAVDPSGCVSVTRRDGQFWSLDLIRGVHIERRSVLDREGGNHLLTALFAADGFRMVTRFQHRSFENDNGQAWLASESTGTFRFYGRDGSMVQFDSEDDLLELNPASVWDPGSRSVERSWRGVHQAGTAWASVQEYITNYLLA